MSDKKIKVAVIAAGGRAICVMKHLLEDSQGNVEIAAVYDPDQAQIDYFCTSVGCANVKYCTSSVEAINTPGVEWVMVFSPNAYHKQHILESFDAGKHVFSEKPLATTIEDCRQIYEAHQRSGKLFATGFVLRYAPIYRKAKAVLNSGRIGRLMTIEANENIRPGHGGYIVCNWRRYSDISGPHILEKCCHDLDLINWFCGSLPSTVASFGKQDFFTPANKAVGDKYGRDKFLVWRDPHRVSEPFSGENDMKDNQVSIIRYRNNILVSFVDVMCNAIPERRMVFHGTEGVMELELYKLTLRIRNIADEGQEVIDFNGDGHGGGDSFIMKELYDTMINGTAPKCSGDEGLESAVLALALDQAAEENRLIDLEEVWQKLGR